jgi:hypothetical protein
VNEPAPLLPINPDSGPAPLLAAPLSGELPPPVDGRDGIEGGDGGFVGIDGGMTGSEW